MNPTHAVITLATSALRVASIVATVAADALEDRITGGPPRPGDRVEVVAGHHAGETGIVIGVCGKRDPRRPRAFGVTIERYNGTTPISPPIFAIWPRSIHILEREERHE